MVTQEHLKNTFIYNSLTGSIKYISGRASGREAGWIDGNGYRSMSINKRNYKAHRLIWLYVYGEWPDDQIDHKNRNRLDNSIDNLRCASNTGNARNQCIQKNNTSGVTGLYWQEEYKSWRVRIGINGKAASIGCFKVFNDAVIARKMAEYEHGYDKTHGGKPRDSEYEQARLEQEK